MVFACTQANSFGVIDCVGAVLPVDTRKEIGELDWGGMVDAVAVDAHIVHHTDEDDALLLLEIVDHALCSGCHTLEETVTPDNR